MRGLSFRAPPTLAVAENATTPVGLTGALIWSSTASKLLVWDGAKWASPAPSAGGAGSGDVVGPAAATADRMAVFADATGKTLKQATYFDTPAIAVPAAPAADTLRWFSRNRAGRVLPHSVGPAGIDTALQPALFANTMTMWLPASGTTASISFGNFWNARNNGTGAAQAHPTKASTNAMTSLSRATFSTGTTATGSSGTQSAQTAAWRGNAAGLGGFFFCARFGVEVLAADMQVLVGLSELNQNLTVDPSTVNNTIAITKSQVDSSWFIVTRSTGNGTKTATGCTITAGQILDVTIFCKPNDTKITVRLSDAVTGQVYMDNVDITATLPSNIIFMYAHAQIRSVTGTTAKLLALNRIYIESDL